MKQRFDHVQASRPRQGTGAPSRTASTPAHAINPAHTVSTPAPTSGSWLSEALKLWCTDPHTRP